MGSLPTGELEAAILATHGVKAVLEGVETVLEAHQGRTVWEGKVGRFKLQGHPTASYCYAWAEPDAGGIYAVLKAGPIDSARKAVQASIIQRG